MAAASHPAARFADIFTFGKSPLRTLVDDSGASAFLWSFKARGALERWLKTIRNVERPVVLVPAFHCPSVIQPIVRAGFEVQFYGVSRSLDVDYESIEALLSRRVAAVLVIHYFGFEAPTTRIAEHCATYGSLLIEDWSHSFLRANPLRLAGAAGDVALYSPWKIVACGTGGVLRRLRDTVELPSDPPPPSCANSLRLLKGLLEESVMNLAPDSFLRRIYVDLENRRVAWRRARVVAAASDAIDDQVIPAIEQAYPELDVYFQSGMPWISRWILDHADLARLCQQRRQAYQQVAEMLSTVPGVRVLRPRLDADTCPWACPVVFDGRAGRDRALRQAGVPFFTFGEILHPLLYTRGTADEVVDDAVALSSDLVCFPTEKPVDADTLRHRRDVIAEIAA